VDLILRHYHTDEDAPIHAIDKPFSKKAENHRWAVALYFMHYNFCRVHQTLRVTPAMEAGITGAFGASKHIVALLDSEQDRAA